MARPRGRPVIRVASSSSGSGCSASKSDVKLGNQIELFLEVSEPAGLRMRAWKTCGESEPGRVSPMVRLALGCEEKVLSDRRIPPRGPWRRRWRHVHGFRG